MVTGERISYTKTKPNSARKITPPKQINIIRKINRLSNKMTSCESEALSLGKSNKTKDTTTMQKKRTAARILPRSLPRAMTKIQIRATTQRIPKTQTPTPNPATNAMPNECNQKINKHNKSRCKQIQNLNKYFRYIYI